MHESNNRSIIILQSLGWSIGSLNLAHHCDNSILILKLFGWNHIAGDFFAVQCKFHDSLADVVRIFHFDVQNLSTEASLNFEAVP